MSFNLQISESSPLHGGNLFTLSDGSLEAYPATIDYEQVPSDIFHSIEPNDTLKGLAQRYYQDVRSNPSRYWHLIYRANDIYDPKDLTILIGETIIIPDLEKFIARYLKRIDIYAR